MLGESPLPKEKSSLHLQVETCQVALSEDVASRRSKRILWTGFGFAALMLIVVSACILVLPSTSRHDPSLAFSPALPALSPARPIRQSGMNAAAARVSPMRMAESTLIIQNKGGGHGEIGYHLALQLAKQKGMKVTILHEGPNKADKPPHSAYGDLADAGVEVIWADSLEKPDSGVIREALKGKKFDAVVDNWSKSPEQIKPYADLAKGWGVENYAYISSAGMYTPAKGDFSVISEDTAVKSSGQRQAEELLADMEMPYSCFRPQYIYGPKQGKSYLKYFFDRAARNRPVLVPNGGDQLVTMTHAADNAAMVAAAIGNAKAAGEVFNCATSSQITYDDLATMCGKAAGNEATKILHYDPKKFDIPKGFFPFRDEQFIVCVDKAADKLAFVPKNFLADDIDWYYKDNYVATGAADKDVDFTLDDEIIGSFLEGKA